MDNYFYQILEQLSPQSNTFTIPNDALELKINLFLQEKVNNDLMSACESGDINYVKVLIEGSHEPHDKVLEVLANPHYEHESPLKMACQNNHLDIVKYLVFEHQCQIESNNDSALFYAARRNNLNIVKFLLNHSTSPANAQTLDNQAFKEACSSGATETVIYLHQLGIDIHAQNDLGFRKACKYGHFEVVQYLSAHVFLDKPILENVIKNSIRKFLTNTDDLDYQRTVFFLLDSLATPSLALIDWLKNQQHKNIDKWLFKHHLEHNLTISDSPPTVHSNTLKHKI